MNKFDFCCTKSVIFHALFLIWYLCIHCSKIKGTLQSLSHISMNDIFLIIDDPAELTENQKTSEWPNPSPLFVTGFWVTLKESSCQTWFWASVNSWTVCGVMWLWSILWNSWEMAMFVKHINTLVNHEMMTQNVNALAYTLTPDSLTSVTCAQCHSSLHFRENTVPMANVNQAASF